MVSDRRSFGSMDVHIYMAFVAATVLTLSKVAISTPYAPIPSGGQSRNLPEKRKETSLNGHSSHPHPSSPFERCPVVLACSGRLGSGDPIT